MGNNAHLVITVGLFVLSCVLCGITYNQYQIEKNLHCDSNSPTCEKPTVPAGVCLVFTIITGVAFLASIVLFRVNTLAKRMKYDWGLPYQPAWEHENYQNNYQNYQNNQKYT